MFRRSQSTARVPAPRRFRPFLGVLETRLAPASFSVTNLSDAGPGSLRQALSDANALAGADTITFGVTGVIPVTSAELSVSDAVAIVGPGAGLLTLASNGTGRVFNTTLATAKTAVSISGLTITGGKAAVGGGIFVQDEALTLTNCVITGNTTTGSGYNGGGGVYCYLAAASLNLQGTTISNNSAAALGGGIAIHHSLSLIIHNSTIANNQAGNVGGGLYNHSAAVLMVNSAVTGNTSTNDGGGLFLPPSSASIELTIRNSTISHNSAGKSGGGVMLEGTATLNLQNCTVTGNSASKNGGGVDDTYKACTLNAESTVIAGNTGGAEPDIGVTTVVAKNSAIGVQSFVFTDLGGNLPFGTNLKLGALANNGGPTKTHLPALDSPLLNAGSNPANETTDQRGDGFSRISNGKPDIGAVEVPIVALVTNTSDSGAGSLRQAVADSNALVGFSGIIQFDAAVFKTAQTITLGSEIAVTNGVSIVGPGSALLTINANNTGRVLNINGGAGSLAVNISGLAITGGKTPQPGGGIFNQDENLSLVDVTVTGNQSGQAGGGIFVQSSAGSLTLQNCVISNNQVVAGIGLKAGDGGGIMLIGNSSVVIDATAITGNTAKENGGGLYFYSGGSLSFTNSTVSGNAAKSGRGGGMYFGGTVTAGGLLVRNSTLSGNSASDSGGGISFNIPEGQLAVTNATITGNTATAGQGGGISQAAGGLGVIAVTSSIVAGNSNAASPDISSGAAVQANNSALGNGTGFTLTDQGGNLAFGANLKLGPLANNGGPTLTHLPLLGSPLINAGANPASLATDQRGAGSYRTVMGQADIGAVEVQDLVVTNANDAGPGTLRQAIADANVLLPGANTISFEPLFFAIARTITLTTGTLAIGDALTITGPGAALLAVNGSKSSRVFSIDKSGSTGVAMVMSGLTISGGSSAAGGGGIFLADEALTLIGCTVTGNQSALAGGGIFVQSGAGSLTLQDCAVTSNQVTAGTGAKAGDGGGINLQGATQVVIDRTTISGNTANENGGGLYFGAGGSLLLMNSTVSGNTAKSQQGAGIFFYGTVTGPGLAIRSSTLSGNTAGSSGGGLCLINLAGTCAITNSTVTANVAQSGFGGGITRASGPGTVALESSIVSGNTNVAAPDIYSYGSVFAKFTAIGSATGFTFTDQGGNLPFGADLKLGPLFNNGGPTQTHALLAGSAAIDKGSNPQSLTTDQRGVGFGRATSGIPDIGAFETQFSRVQALVINGGAVQRSRVTSIAIVFSDIVTFSGTPNAAIDLRRQSDNALPTFNAKLDSTGPATFVTLTFSGSTAVDFGSLADGRYTLTIDASQVTGPLGNLDGDNNGTPGGNYTLVGSPANGLFRFFGDSDGDGDTDTTDFAVFKSAFGVSDSIFNYDDDGDTDTSDFGQFRARFGKTV